MMVFTGIVPVNGSVVLSDCEVLPVENTPRQAFQPDTTRIVCPVDILTYTDVSSCNTLISSGLELIDPGNNLVSLSWQLEGATNASSPSSGINQLSSYVFNEGTTVVTYRGRDRSNRPVFCSFTIVVADNEVPRLMNPPQHISVEADPGDCQAIVNWQEPIVLDNCASRDQILVDANYMPGSAFPVGTTEVFFSISDGVEYNRDEYSFTVTVTDDEKPEIYAPNPTHVKCGEPVPDAFTNWRQFEDAGGVAFDNCNIDVGSFRFVGQKSSGIRCPYAVTRTYSIADDYGNITEVEHLVYVTGEEEVPEETQVEPVLKSGTGTRAITVTLVNITDVACFGGADGAIDLDTSSTAGPIISIVWSNGATTLDVSGLSAGSYSVDITDGEGTQNFGPYSVSQPAALTASILSQTEACFGQSTGTATISAGGGTPPYLYSSDGITFQAGVTLAALSGGTHTITIRDNNACEVTTTVTITETDEFSPGAHNTTDIDACPGYNPAALQVGGYTGLAPFSFQWYHNGSAVGSNSDTYDPGQLTTVQTHAFYCVVTDACGFSANTDSKTITIVDEPQISINNGGTYCLGDAITLTTTITGGTGTFENYVWREGSSSTGPWNSIPGETSSSYSPPSNVSGTTYYSVVLDPNVVSCNNTSASVAVIINPLPTASITGNNGPVCSGDDATFNLTGTANATVTYTINSGSNQTISLNGSGTATIYEYDVTSDQTLDLVSVESTATGCSQNVTGSSTVTVTPTNTISLYSGTEPTEVCVSTSMTSIIYNTTGATGATVVGLPNGVSGSWSSNRVTISGSPTVAGTFNYTITLTGGCGAITQNGNIQVNPTMTRTLTSAPGTEIQTVCVNKPIEDVTYATTGATGISFTGLPTGVSGTLTGNTITITGTPTVAGNYAYIGTLEGGCGTVTIVGGITVTPPINATAVISDPIDCFGGSTSVLITATGGTPPYTFYFDGKPSNHTGLFTGVVGSETAYNWSVTDSKGCDEFFGQITVSEPEPISAAASTTTPILCNGGTGTVTITASGGTPPYSYILNGRTNSTGVFTNTAAGNISWSVSDSKNCEPVTGTINVLQPDPVTIVSAVVTSPIACNGGTATVTIQASGGSGNYTYTFNGQTNSTGIFTGVYAGTNLSISVVDDKGCGPVFDQITINDMPALNATVTPSQMLCNGGTPSGEIEVSNPIGGSGNYEVSVDGTNWNTILSGSSYTFTGLATGNYYVQIRDQATPTCIQTLPVVTITQPPVLNAEIDVTSIACYGETSSVQITATGGTPGTPAYQYYIDNVEDVDGDGIFELAGSVAGTDYDWKAVDANGCEDGGTITITQPAEITNLAVSADDNEICAGENIALQASANGGTSPLKYNWTGPDGFAKTNTQNPVRTNAGTTAEGWYVVTVVDANNCSKKDSVFVTVNPSPSLSSPGNFVFCGGTTNGPISFSGDPGNTYTWTNSNTDIGLPASGNTEIPEFTSPDNFDVEIVANITVTPTSADGCEGNPVTFTITVNPKLELTITPSTPVLCGNGNVSIALNSNVSGTVYHWDYSTGSPGSGNIINEFLTNTHTYTIYAEANGCYSDTFTTTVTVIDEDFDLEVNTTGPNATNFCPGENFNISFSGSPSGSGGGSISTGWFTRTDWEWETQFTYTISNPNVTAVTSGGPFNDPGNFNFDVENTTDNVQTAIVTITPWSYYRETDCSWWFGWSCNPWPSSWTQLCAGEPYEIEITVQPFAIECPTDITTTTSLDDCFAELSPGTPVTTCPVNANLSWDLINGSTTDSGNDVLENYQFAPGTTTVTYTAEDNGEYRSCSFDIIVADEQAPTINCPSSDTTIYAAAGQCGVNFDFSHIQASDNCTVDQFIQIEGPASNTLFPVGTTALGFYAEDEAGNSAECSFGVIVLDTISPTISCIGDTTVCAEPGMNYTNVGTGWNATASDNCSGATVTYSVDGAPVGNTLNNVSFSVAGSPHAVVATVTDAAGKTASCSFAVTVNEKPSVIAQPVGDAVCLSGDYEFTVTVGGAAPLSYQWRKNGNPLSNGGVYSGADTDALNISGLTAAEAGSYDVVVSNNCGSVTSAPATLSVSSAPYITQQPANQTDCLGEDVDFTVTVSGGVVATDYGYAWERWDNTAGDWVLISGATGSVLSLTNIGTGDNVDGTQYRVRIEDDCGIKDTSSVATLTVNQVVTPSPVSITLCQGEDTTFMVSTSGTTPVSYEWQLNGSTISNGGAFSGANTNVLTVANAQATENGTYSVRATFNITQPNNNGAGVTTCVSDFVEVGTLTVDQGLDIVATPETQTSCSGAAITPITISNSNGITGITYSWVRDNTLVLTGIAESGEGDISGVLSSVDPSVLQTTTFTITAATVNGCESVKTVTVTIGDTVPPSPDFCPGTTTVSADAGICGAVVNYTKPTFADNCLGYGHRDLVAGLDSGAVFPIGTTTVTWEYYDAAGNGPATCSFDISVNDDVPPVASCQLLPVEVELDASGFASISVNDINNNSSDNCGIDSMWLDITSFDCTNLGDNTVTLTVRDSSGLTDQCSATVTVQDNNNPVDIEVSSITQTPIDCNGGTATVTISASGGVGQLTYTLGTESNTDGIFTNISAGSYSWSVSDSQHCGDTVSVVDFVVVQPGELSANIALTEVTCSSGDDGTITVIGSSGGSGDYEYQLYQNSAVIRPWQSDSVFAGLSPGFYDIWMRDANATACELEIQSNVEVYIITADISTSNITCFNGNDGSISISNPAGGNSPYYYSIDGTDFSNTTGLFTGLSADTFDVQIQDNDGCVVVLDSMVILTQPDSLDATLASTNVSCGGANDGTITISGATGGVGPYQYSIDGSDFTNTSGIFSGLAPGSYDVWIMDASSCQKLLTIVEINEFPPLNADLDSSNVTCFGGSDGTIEILNPTGGSGSYEYSIDNGASWQADGNYTGLTAGTYQVFMRDSNAVACVLELDANLVLSQPAAMVISTEPVDFADCVGATAQFSVVHTAGVGTVTYTWQKEISGTWTNLANGGDISGANLGSLQISNIELPDTGLYRVLVADDCLADTSMAAQLIVNDLVSLTPGNVTTQICSGNDTAFTVIVSGENPVYQWQKNISGTWTDLTDGAVISGSNSYRLKFSGTSTAETGEYRVVVSFDSSSGSGCSISSDSRFERHLNVLPSPTLDSIPDFTYCEGDFPAPIPLVGSPVNVTYDMTVSNYIGLFSQTNITSGQIVFPGFVTWGTATVTVTPKANGCVGEPRSFVIHVDPKPIFSVAPPVQSVCSGVETNIVFNGNTDSIRYTWTVAVNPNDGSVTGWEEVTDSLATGIRQTLMNNNSTSATVTYTVTPYKNGCTGLPNTVTINVRPAIELVITDPDTVCEPARVDLTDPAIVAGSTAGLSYEYYLDSSLFSYVSDPTQTNTGKYYIKGTDPATGCYLIKPVVVTVVPAPHLTSTLTPTGICSNEAFHYTPTSDIPGTTFEWSREAIAGISNPPDSGTDDPDEYLENTTTNPIPVVYTYTLSFGECSSTQEVVVMVTPTPQLDNYTPPDICSGSVFSYEPTSSTGGTTFSWTRAAEPGISNPPASGTGNPNEVLINTTANPVSATYYYTLTSNDCTNPAVYPVAVVVIPSPNVTASSSETEVCPGESVNLFSSSDIVGTTLPPILLSSNFDSTPTGWTRNPNTNNNGSWVLSSNYGVGGGNYINNGGSQFYVADMRNADRTSTLTMTNPVNTVGYTSLELSFEHYYRSGGNSDHAEILVSTNGTNWTEIHEFTSSQGDRTNFTTYSINLDSYIAYSTLYIRFNYSGDGDYYWAIDNVTLSGVGGTQPEVHWTSVPAGFTSDVANPTNVVVSQETAFIATYLDPDTNCPGSDTVIVTMKDHPEPYIAADYCAIDGKIELTALGGASGATYTWTTGEHTQAIVIDEVNIYGVTITNPNGCSATDYLDVSNELVVNGDFEAGDTGFGSGYGYRPSWTYPGLATTSANSSLWDENYYGIGTNARYYHTNFWGHQDHTSGTGNFMIVNGNLNEGTAIWEETVIVEANTNYYFSAWSMSLNSVGNDAVLQFEVNDSLVGTQARLTPGLSNDNNNGWVRFYSNPLWNSGSVSGPITIRIRNVEPAASGNDFALDDISFGTLDPLPLEIDVIANEVCEGDTLFLQSNPVNGLEPITYAWTGPNGWTSNEANPVIPNISLADAGQYKLAATDGYGCDILPDSVIVVVETAPTVDAGPDVTVCSADSIITLAGLIGGSATLGTWSGGSGNFNPGVNAPDALYTLSQAEISAGMVALVLSTDDPAGVCEPASDTMIISIHESPVIDSIVTKEPLCNSVSDGTARIYVSGGATPYTYLWSTGHTTPSISNLGADTFWVQVTDANLCVVSDTFVIEEPEPFVISPSSPIVVPPSCYGADDGWALVEVSGGIPPYRFDWDANADPMNVYQDTAFNLSAGIYYVYVTDSAYCAASNIQVTVPQPPPPVLTCPPDYEDVISPDSCSITYDTIVDPYYNGFCDVTLTYTVSGATQASGTGSVNGQVAFNVGQSLVEYRIEDTAGNIDSCSFTVWVKHLDIPTPDITCPELSPDPVYADADCDADVTLDPPTYTDPCNEIDSIWNNSPATGATPANASGTYPIGTTEFKWFVLDKSGNMDSSCVVQVSVLDTTKPYITCPSNAIDSAAANNCSKTPGTLTDPTYGDLCSDVTLSWKMEGATTGTGLGTVTDSVFNVGLTTVTYYVEDDAGNRDSCSFTVQIMDVTDPYISIGCESVSDTAAANLCSKVSGKLKDPVLDDNCWDPDSLTLTWTMSGATTGSGNGSVKDSTFNVGVTTVTYTVTDPDGNWDECTFTVTIVDVIDPEISVGCNSVADTLAPNECSKQSALLDEPVLYDNCWDPDSLTLTWTMSGATTGTGVGSVADSTFNIGVTTVTYTVTDPDGNSADCSFTVTIAGINAPGISLGCESFSDTVGVNNCYLISAKLKDPVFDDNCWPDSMLTLTWVMSGATTGSGDGSVKDSTFNVGVTHVIYTVTDPDGLSATCEFDVTILHIEIPTANYTCPQDTVWATPDAGNCDADVTLGVLTYTDPCNEIDSVWNESPFRTSPSDASGTYPVGVTTFNWYITDISGNIDSCAVTVIVEDLLPTIDCPDSIVDFADFGEEYNSAVSLQDPVYGDNCPDPVLTWWLIPPTGYETEYNSAELSGAGIYVSPDTFWIGVTTIWYKVVDSQGNADSCSFTVTIEAAPDIECPPDTTIYLDGSEGNCEATFDPGVPDLLEGVPPITWSFTIVFADGRPDSTGTYVSPAPGDALPMGDIDFPLGVTTISWRAENDAGFDTCSHWIEVIDTIPPTLDANPYENCVDPLHWVVYNPTNPNPSLEDAEHVDPNLEKSPIDYRTLFAGDTDLDLTLLEDNCCDSVSMVPDLHWCIAFNYTYDPADGSLVTHDTICGTGQPSTYTEGGIATDIYLWGDGVYFNTITHHITYWVIDCNGNVSDEITKEIVITPRPQVIKED